MLRLAGFIVRLIIGAAIGLLIMIFIDPVRSCRAISFANSAYNSLQRDINMWTKRVSAAVDTGRKAAREAEERLDQETSHGPRSSSEEFPKYIV